MSDITTFLLARIAEDEQLAREALRLTEPRQRWSVTETWGEVSDRSGTVNQLFYVTAWANGSHAIGRSAQADDRAVYDHLARHDPARVLAECEAKRRIVELHSGDEPLRAHDCPGRSWLDDEAVAYIGGERVTYVHPCPTLRALAVAYRDHPDYQQEWSG